MDNNLEQTMLQGLTEQEARERLATDGYNELPTAKKRTVFHIPWGAATKSVIFNIAG